MKKTYQKPEIEMVLVAQTLLQAASPGVGDDITEGEGDVKQYRGGSSNWDNDDWDE